MHSLVPALILLLTLTAFGGDAAAQQTDAADRLRQAERALGEERFDDAVRLTEEVLEQTPDDVTARLVRAHALLLGDPARPDAAGEDIAFVLDDDPDNARAQELDLWRDYRHGSSFLLPFRTSDRLRRARRIVEADSSRRLAHLVVGLIRYTDFKDSYQTVRFRSFSRPGDAIDADDRITDAAAWLFDTGVDTDGEEPVLTFRDPSVTGFTMDYTPLSDAEDEFAREAVRHLLAAAGSDRIGLTAHRFLADVHVRTGQLDAGAAAATALIESGPDHADGWMYRGMFRALAGDWEGADRDFEHAFERSDASVRRAMTSPELFTLTREGGDASGTITPLEYWIENDPLWSTEPNEALVEHVARMVEADLRFWDPDESGRGWESDAGVVFVRYGAPIVTARYSSLTEGYMLLHYGDRRFMFMVPGRRGTYTFYSPSATAFSGSRGNVRQWESDQEIASREAFNEEPRRSNVLDGRRTSLDAVISAFRGDSPAVVAAWCSTEPADDAQLFELPAESYEPVRIARLDQPEPLVLGDARPDDECMTYVMNASTTEAAARYSLEVRAADRVGVQRFERTLPAGEMMTMSDVMPARLVQEAADAPRDARALRRGGHVIYPAGSATIAVGTDLYLYFELYGTGAAASRPLTVRIQAALVPGTDDDEGRLERLLGRVFDNSESAPVSVDFEEPVSTKDVHRYLILGTEDLDAGRYDVAIRVTHPETGRTAQSIRTIELTESNED